MQKVAYAFAVQHILVSLFWQGNLLLSNPLYVPQLQSKIKHTKTGNKIKNILIKIGKN